MIQLLIVLLVVVGTGLGLLLWRRRAGRTPLRLPFVSKLRRGAPPRPGRPLDRARGLRGNIVVLHETSKRLSDGTVYITPHQMILREAVAKNIVLLNVDGKIAGKRRGVTIELPAGTRYQDVFAVRPTKLIQSGVDSETGLELGRNVLTPWPTGRRG
jgi:hypothetical protein